MNRIFKSIIALSCASTLVLGMGSCQKSDPVYVYYPNSLVTLKPTGDTFVIQLDDETVAVPTNIKKSPWGDKEVRVLGNMERDKSFDGTGIGMKINWMDTVLTKNMKPWLETAEANDKAYGKDPVRIVTESWMTGVEDGYLNIVFRTDWGFSGIRHEVNLLQNVDPEDPYTVYFKHNAHGDSHQEYKDGIVVFRLKDLPDTGNETKTLKVKYDSYDGVKTIEFKYKTRADNPATDKE